MRTYRDANGSGLDGPPGLLGEEQLAWLVREVASSRATWKVISADLPLSLASNSDDDRDSFANDDHGVPLGREQELAALLSAFKRHGVRNVVWITADVHYTAAHHYSPERAAFTDFDPFWEFVSGPIAAGALPGQGAGPNVRGGSGLRPCRRDARSGSRRPRTTSSSARPGSRRRAS